MTNPLEKMRLRTRGLEGKTAALMGKGVRKNVDGTPRTHQGWDLDASIGTTTYAIADGTVEDVNSRGDLGTQCSPETRSEFAS
jgi:murein DD-endopeptidase MepM/ murein hydrolase activator NlpD